VGGLVSFAIYTGAAAGVYLPTFDGNGNVMALVNAANGASVAQYEYDAFGNLVQATGPMATANNILSSSKYFDWETGLYYYGYRYYNANTGRWLSRDPIEEKGGFDLYANCQNDLVDEADPLGLADLVKGATLLMQHNGPPGGFANLLQPLGYVWNLPNTAIGLLWGGLGIPFGASVTNNGNNAIQFINDPLMIGGNITIGNVQCYNPKIGPNVRDVWWYTNGVVTFGDHENAHVPQEEVLGPLFFPAYGVGGIIAVLRGGNFFMDLNPFEAGPYSTPPSSWPRWNYRP
jgi:RHS repeat-associated protein